MSNLPANASDRGEILFYSDFPFGYHNTEAEEKMARFAERGYRVHYVEQLGIRNPRLRHLPRLMRSVFSRSAPANGRPRPYDVVSPKLLAPRRAPAVGAINRAWLARQLESRVERMSETIIWIRYPTPELLGLLERARPRLVVYEVVDDHEHSPGMTDRLRRIFRATEAEVLSRAGVVFAWSEPLRDRLEGLHPNVHWAPAAVDTDRFADALERGRHSEQVAVYAGSIDFRFDAGLLVAVAERLPQWSFVLAGPVEPAIEPKLRQASNVQLAGNLSHESIPEMLARASVCLMPYKSGSYADKLFPIKLVEYLAAGRPVVSAPIRAIRDFSDVVTVAAEPDDFAAAIEAAALDDSEQARRLRIARAAPFSWKRRIDEMEDALEQAMGHE